MHGWYRRRRGGSCGDSDGFLVWHAHNDDGKGDGQADAHVDHDGPVPVQPPQSKVHMTCINTRLNLYFLAFHGTLKVQPPQY